MPSQDVPEAPEPKAATGGRATPLRRTCASARKSCASGPVPAGSVPARPSPARCARPRQCHLAASSSCSWSFLLQKFADFLELVLADLFLFQKAREQRRQLSAEHPVDKSPARLMHAARLLHC